MCDCPELGALIAYCGHLGKQSMDQLLRRAGYDVTPAQTHLLMRLTCTGEGQEATQRDLEKQLRLKPPTVNGIVDRLEAKGYVTRRPSPQDGRVRLVSLTEAGWRTSAVSWRRRSACIRRASPARSGNSWSGSSTRLSQTWKTR